MRMVNREKRYSEGTYEAVVVPVRSPSYGLMGPQSKEIEIPLVVLTGLIYQQRKMTPESFKSYLEVEALLSKEWRLAYKEIDWRLRLYTQILTPAGFPEDPKTETVIAAVMSALRLPSAAALEIS